MAEDFVRDQTLASRVLRALREAETLARSDVRRGFGEAALVVPHATGDGMTAGDVRKAHPLGQHEPTA